MLGKLSRSAVVIAAVSIPLAFGSTGSAYAATAAASVVTGSGTINFLNVLNPGATFSFDGSGTTAGVVCTTPGVSTTTIHASGSDLVGSYGVGAGPVKINVSDPRCAPITLDGNFVRVGVVVVVEATSGTNAAAAVCGFVPGQTPPANVTSYTLACGATIAGTA